MTAIHESEALACSVAFRDGFAIQFGELGFVFEEIELGGATCHEQKDHIFGFGGKMTALWLQRVAHFRCRGSHQGGKRDGADTDGAATEKVTAGDMPQGVVRVHDEK